MRSHVVEVDPPGSESRPSLGDGADPLGVQALVAQSAVEGRDEGDLHRPPGPAGSELDTTSVSPRVEDVRSGLRAVVERQRTGLRALRDDPLEHGRDELRAHPPSGLAGQRLATQQPSQAAVAESRSSGGELPPTLAERDLLDLHAAVAMAAPRDLHQPTRAPLADAAALPVLANELAAVRGLHRSFRRASCRISVSSARSATICSSLRFSSSRDSSRQTSDVESPLYVEPQRRADYWLTPYVRQCSAMGTPAWSRFRAVAICSEVERELRTRA